MLGWAGFHYSILDKEEYEEIVGNFFNLGTGNKTENPKKMVFV